ncbi:MAG: translation elongation factor G-related protein [Frankiales bacterium]|nr:translation elongation factor G-related protein [Frankiales bacterium]
MTRSPSPARFVAVLGHDGAGKSTLIEALGGPSTPSGVVLLEGRASLPLCDAVLFVLSSPQGLDPTLPLRWEEAGEAGLPRLLVVTQLDLPRADVDETLAVLQRVLGEGVHPLALPVLDDDERITGLLRLLDLQLLVGGEARDAEPEHAGLVETLREDLLETLLSGSEDDDLFDAWLGGALPSPEVLVRELHAAVRAGSLHPVLPVTADGVGAPELLDLLVAVVPASVEVPPPAVHAPDGRTVQLTGDPSGPLAVRVAEGGLARVLSGTLRDGDGLTVGTAQLQDLDGAPLAEAPAGTACRLPGLAAGLHSDPAEPLALDEA